jgi:hypothetical protein
VSGTQWYIRLTVDFDHGYLCSGRGACAIELHHANIASAFIARAAREWNVYERTPYSDRATCLADAAFWARDIQINLLNSRRWPTGLPRQYLEAQRNYEATHNGICRLMPGACGAY